MMTSYRVHRIANALGLLLVCAALVIAFVDQFAANDLPCPLCLLQRACLIAVGIALCMNLQYGVKTMHYGLLILAALLGLSIAVWQIFLHMAPHDPGYGGLFLGLHFYDWAALCFSAMLIATAIALLIEGGFDHPTSPVSLWLKWLILLFMLLIFANIVSTVFECGLTACPADPVDYQLLDSVG